MVNQYRFYAITDFKLLRNCWSTFELAINEHLMRQRSGGASAQRICKRLQHHRLQFPAMPVQGHG
jgi:hypothetical protein